MQDLLFSHVVYAVACWLSVTPKVCVDDEDDALPAAAVDAVADSVIR